MKKKEPQKAEKTKKFTICLPEELYMDFKLQTEQEGTTIDAVIEKLIFSYVLAALEPEDGCFCCPKEQAGKYE